MFFARFIWMWGRRGATEAQRLAALQSFSAHPGGTRRFKVVGALADDSPRVRLAAIEALSAAGGDKTLRPLARAATRDDDPRVRATAAKALGVLGFEEALPPLHAALNDPDGLVRSAAAIALGELHHPRAVPWLEARLRDEDDEVRVGALDGLAGIGTPLAIGALADALGDREDRVRSKASELLCLLGGPSVLQAIMSRLEDHQGRAREAAANLLARLGDRRAVPALLNTLSDADAPVRIAAISALGLLGDPRATGALEQCLRDTDQRVRDAARQALRMIGVQPKAGNPGMMLPPTNELPSPVHVNRTPSRPTPEFSGPKAAVRRIATADITGEGPSPRRPEPVASSPAPVPQEEIDPLAEQRLPPGDSELAQRIREKLRGAGARADSLRQLAAEETRRPPKDRPMDTYLKLADAFERAVTDPPSSSTLRTPAPVVDVTPSTARTPRPTPSVSGDSGEFPPPRTVESPSIAAGLPGQRELPASEQTFTMLPDGMRSEAPAPSSPASSDDAHVETEAALGGDVTRRRTRSTDLAPLLAIAGRQGPGTWVDDVIESLLRARADELSVEQLQALLRIAPSGETPLPESMESGHAALYRIRRLARRELDRRRDVG